LQKSATANTRPKNSSNPSAMLLECSASLSFSSLQKMFYLLTNSALGPTISLQ
jgi:hypothetical protein